VTHSTTQESLWLLIDTCQQDLESADMSLHSSWSGLEALIRQTVRSEAAETPELGDEIISALAESGFWSSEGGDYRYTAKELRVDSRSSLPLRPESPDHMLYPATKQGDPAVTTATPTPVLDQVQIVLRLSRAKITPMTHSDWHCWAGAMGDAHIVEFAPSDERAMLTSLGAEHLRSLCLTWILDDGGLTVNALDERGYAYAATIKLLVDNHDLEIVEENDQNGYVGYRRGTIKVNGQFFRPLEPNGTQQARQLPARTGWWVISEKED